MHVTLAAEQRGSVLLGLPAGASHPEMEVAGPEDLREIGWKQI